MAETETERPEPTNLVEVTAEIVSAYVGNNTIATADLPSLISSVAGQLGRLEQAHAENPSNRRQPSRSIGRCASRTSFAWFVASRRSYSSGTWRQRTT